MALEPGATIGPFVIEELLGRGGMGAVYRALDPRLGRHVALKVLEELAKDPAAAARFSREARSIAALDHPNAVHVYEAGESGGIPYIAMELVEGVTLREAAAEERAWPVKLRWLLDVASALAAAHDAGLVHRDVKPDNVMVRRDGRIKVLDFGIARRFGEASSASTTAAVTRDGMIIGTPRYMSPEQLRGEEIDGRADQFAWGVMAYELFTGQVPWGATTDVIPLIAHVLGTTPEPLADRVPELPRAVVEVVERAMSKNPAARFASLEDAIARVTSLAASPPSARLRVTIAPPGAASEIAQTVAADASGARRAKPTLVSSGRRSMLPWVVGALVSLSVGVALWRGVDRKPPPPSETHAAASSSAYAAAITTFVTESEYAGIAALQAIPESDHSACEARLRLALYDDRSPGLARERLDSLRACRPRMSESDRELLDTALSILDPELSPVEVARRFGAFADKRPKDPEAAFLSALTLYELPGGPKQAHSRLVSCLASDPRFGPCYSLTAHLFDDDGKPADSARVASDCFAALGESTRCWRIRLRGLELGTDCATLEQKARRWVATAPTQPAAYSWLFLSLMANDGPRPATAEALRQFIQRSPKSDLGDSTIAFYRVLEALHYGAFDESLRALDVEETSVVVKASAESRARIAWTRASVLREIGDTDGAKKVVRDFLELARALEPPPPVARLLEIETLAADLGEIPRKRLTDDRAKAFHAGAVESWLDVHALASTPEDAKLAVSLAPAGLLADEARAMDATTRARLSQVLVLAGQPNATQRLSKSLSPCDRWEWSFEANRLRLVLGKSFEAAGDIPGARREYERIIAAWGDAKPRSTTATEAKSRLLALGSR